MGIYDSSTPGVTITGNAISGGDWGILAGDDADIERNTITGAANAVNASASAGHSLTISHNNISDPTASGIVAYGTATIEYNTIGAAAYTGITAIQAGDYYSQSNNATIRYNTINNLDTGIAVWNWGSTGASTTVTGNTITGPSASDDPYSTAIVTNGPATISGNAIAQVGNGIKVSPAAGQTVTVTNNLLSGNPGGDSWGLWVAVTPTTATVNLGGNRYATTIDTYIFLDTSPVSIDATGEYFDAAYDPGTGVTGGTLAASGTLSQQYGFADRIVDGVDAPGLGLVRTEAANVYVTPNSYSADAGTSSPDIQRGIDAATGGTLTTTGDIVNVQAGTYAGNVSVGKALTLQSTDGSAATTINGTLAVSVGGVAVGGTGAGFTITGTPASGPIVSLGGTGGSFVGNVIDGDSPAGDLLLTGTGKTISGDTFDAPATYAADAYQVQDNTGTYGIGSLLSGNTFDRAVTVTHSGSLLPTIWANVQGGVDAASPSVIDTVNVAAGLYQERIAITKPVTVLGATANVDRTATPFPRATPGQASRSSATPSPRRC